MICEQMLWELKKKGLVYDNQDIKYFTHENVLLFKQHFFSKFLSVCAFYPHEIYFFPMFFGEKRVCVL